MASSPSPSEFLTFYRRITTHPSLRRSIAVSQRASITATRPFSSSLAARYGTGKPSTDASVDTSLYPDDKHTTNKDDKLDVQNANSHAGKESHATGTGGQATSRKDERNNTERAKKDHPEAPDVVIGMQDERGGKGH